jgi:hypothetical protein
MSVLYGPADRQLDSAPAGHSYIIAKKHINLLRSGEPVLETRAGERHKQCCVTSKLCSQKSVFNTTLLGRGVVLLWPHVAVVVSENKCVPCPPRVVCVCVNAEQPATAPTG